MSIVMMANYNQVKKIIEEWKKAGRSKGFIVRDAAERCMGWPYVFGAAGCNCSPANRRKYAGYHPDRQAKIYGACPVLSGKQDTCEGCKWDGCLAFDCRGFTRWLLSQVSLTLYGDTVSTQWETDSNWVKKGDISEMPEDLVCCVFREGHTGMYVTGSRVIHCSTNVKSEELPGKPKWLRYGIPAGLYTDEELREAGVDVSPEKNVPTLRKGSKGQAVSSLQSLLNELGANLAVDGDYGAKTEEAVKQFQAGHGLKADGIVGPKTRAALEKVIENGTYTPPQDPQPEPEPDMPEKPDYDPETVTLCIPNLTKAQAELFIQLWQGAYIAE